MSPHLQLVFSTVLPIMQIRLLSGGEFKFLIFRVFKFYLQSDGRCVSQCNPGYFANNVTRKCDKCSATCYECHGPGRDQCLSCHGKSYLSSGQCTMTCPDGRYQDQSSYQCQPCHPSCSKCHGPGGHNCSACHDTSLLSAGQCLSCDTGHYLDPGHQCQQCHDTCYTCSSDGEHGCVTCKPGLHWDDKQAKCEDAALFDFHHMSSYLIILLWLIGKRS